MPSPIAHAATGYILGQLMPLDKLGSPVAKKWKMRFLYPVLVAIAADIDFIPQLITNERFHRGLTHSLFFTCVFSVIVGWILSRVWHSSCTVLIGTTLALYGSHIALDLLGAGGPGLQLLLPFTDGYYSSPVKVFPQVHHSRGLWDAGHLLPLSFELTYSVLLLKLSSVWKRYRINRLKKMQMVASPNSKHYSNSANGDRE